MCFKNLFLVGTLNKFQEYFEDSLIIQLYWENSIDLIKGKPIAFDKKKSTFRL